MADQKFIKDQTTTEYLKRLIDFSSHR